MIMIGMMIQQPINLGSAEQHPTPIKQVEHHQVKWSQSQWWSSNQPIFRMQSETHQLNK